MKKVLLLACAAIVAIGLGACGDDDEMIPAVQLPESAKTFVAKFFPGAEIVKVEKDGRHDSTEYTVTFASGYKVEFDSLGEWTDVDAPSGSIIPSGIAPAVIEEYVSNYFPGNGINEISRDYHGYDVDLVSGVELTFTLDGQLIEIS